MWKQQLHAHPLWRFLRTPKGLLLAIFAMLVAVTSLKLGSSIVLPKVAVAALAAAALDMAIEYVRHRRWILPDGAVLTGMIVAFILSPEERLLIVVATVALAIVSKHLLRTRWSNVFNPAALALVIAAIFLHTGQSWWGALPDLGIVGALIILVMGAFVADRLNKLPMILAFVGGYFTLLTINGFVSSSAVAETFQTPDLQAALFFAFFMLDDPPTSPVRHEDQVVFGIIAATVSYFVFRVYGGVYYLSAGLLVANFWESSRRVVMGRLRTGAITLALTGRRMRFNMPDGDTARRLRIIAASGAAVVAVAMLIAATVTSSDDASQALGSNSVVTQPTAAPSAAASSPFPFLATFSGDLTGTYAQTQDGTTTSLTIDAATTGELALNMHLELSTTGGASGGTRQTVTANKAQLLDPKTNTVVCDGKLVAFNSSLVRATCQGSGPYSNVQMTFEPNMQSDSPTTLSGTITGDMQRTP